jgi:hypothetical protein
MEDKSTEEEYLHDLDKWVGGHEIHSLPENFLVVGSDRNDEKVDAQVYNQEYHKKCPHESHYEFFGQRGKSKKLTHNRRVFE